jgi:hypothetical protein
VSNISVKLDGKNPLILRPADYITTGGEASIYRVKSLVIKIFTDRDKMVQNRYDDKISLLASNFKHPYIISPQGLVKDTTNHSIGYYMPFADGEPYSRVFTTAFRQRTGFSDKDALSLVEKMRDVVDFAHTNNALLVDANELNWLMVKNKEAEPRVLDVDSWQIGNKWPASVIMPSIRDYHSSAFNEFTDWFSWGVVTFQLFTGIHPYKGRLDGYKPSEMELRMRDNASVFHPGINLNQNVKDFSCIPSTLYDWYHSVFEEGTRIPPPTSFTTIVQKAPVNRIFRHTVTATGSLKYDKLFDGGNDPIVQFYPCGLALRKSGHILDLNTKKDMFNYNIGVYNREIIRVGDGYLVVEENKGQNIPGTNYNSKENLLYYHIDERNYTITPLSLSSNATKFFRASNRLFIVDNGLCELSMFNFEHPLLTKGTIWNILPLATEFYNNVAVQNYLGSKFFVLPIGDKGCLTIRVPELDNIQIVSATAGYRFVAVVGLDSSGLYKRLEFVFDKDHKTYTRTILDADNSDINSVVLPNGVTASIYHDGELVICVPAQGVVKKIADRMIDTQIQLDQLGNKVVYIRDGNLWQVSTS